MPISRRTAILGLGASAGAALASLPAHASVDQKIRVADKPVELVVFPVGRRIVGVSMVADVGESPAPFSDGVLTRRDWGEPVLRVTALAEPRSVSCGDGA